MRSQALRSACMCSIRLTELVCALGKERRQFLMDAVTRQILVGSLQEMSCCDVATSTAVMQTVARKKQTLRVWHARTSGGA